MRLTPEQLQNMPDSFKKANPHLYHDLGGLAATLRHYRASDPSKPVLEPAKEVKQAIRVSQAEKLKARFLEQWRLAKGPWPLASEYRFHPTRKWRFDYASAQAFVAIEIEGGTWVNGAHSRGGHFNSDCEKYNQATLLGWRVFRLTTNMMKPEFVGPIADFFRKEME